MEEVKQYLYYCKEDRGLSNSFINQTIGALKVLRQDVLGLSWDEGVKIKRPRRDYLMPEILSKEEVNRMLAVTTNPKHKAILGVLYCTGMRRGELIALRPGDIDSNRKIIRVRAGKGNKTRDTLLAERALEMLRTYYRYNCPRCTHYVFEAGHRPGLPYSASSVGKVVKRAAKKAEISKVVTPHSLRHAFATHMLEGGANLKLIQKLLGHRSLRSTMVYLHLATIDPSVKSPLDQIDQ